MLQCVFNAIKQRCYNTNTIGHTYYGEVGVGVCEEWLRHNSCEAFVEWALANGYRPGMSLTLTDKDRDYSPTNCYWVLTNKISRKRRSAFTVTYEGRHIQLVDLVELYHPNYDQRLLKVIRTRILALNWELEAAITTPVNRKGHRFPNVPRVSAYVTIVSLQR